MSGSANPPKKPWRRDSRYTLAELTIQIVETAEGWVFSEHDFASAEDAEDAAKMRNGGVKQVAYALTTEALRREAFLCLLAEMSARPGALEQYVAGNDEYRDTFERKLAGAALASLVGVSQKMLPDITREVLHMAMQQITRTNGAPTE